jgi:hypothetical protein
MSQFSNPNFGYSRSFNLSSASYGAPFVDLFQSLGYGKRKSRLENELKSLWASKGLDCEVVYTSFASIDACPSATIEARKLLASLGTGRNGFEATDLISFLGESWQKHQFSLSIGNG